MLETRQTEPLGVPETESLRYLPEGPIAIGDGTFSWVAIQHGSKATTGSLNLFDLGSGINRSYDLPGRPGFAVPGDAPNTFVVGCERSLGIFNVVDSSWEVFCDGIDADVDNTIINDGMRYEDNLIFGTKDLDFSAKKAGLYLYRGSDKQLVRLRNDQICSNGKSIIKTADGDLTLIDIDSPTRQIVGYPIDIDQGRLGPPQVVIDLTDDPGVPDGAITTPDERGVIVSIYRPAGVAAGGDRDPGESPGQTRLYDISTGELRCVWQTPGSPQNTCPALVPWNGSLKLVITTAVESMSEDRRAGCPSAGQIFIGNADFLAPNGHTK